MSTELRTGHEAGDDGFHEIQLNGKQLVFLGMATTLVSVVIFLCGVLVGRGVRPIEPVAEAAVMGAPAAEATAESTIADAAPPPSAPAAAPAAAPVDEPTPVSEAEPAEAPPDGTTEAVRAETAPVAARAVPAPKPAAVPTSAEAARPAGGPATRPDAAASEARAAEKKPAEAAESSPAAATVAEANPAEPASAAAPAPEAKSPTAGKVAVQVAALGNRADAEAVARRLSGKGYAAYIVSPEPGGKAVFRVRVGNYASLDEAQRISSRLAQEEKLKPWIIR